MIFITQWYYILRVFPRNVTYNVIEICVEIWKCKPVIHTFNQKVELHTWYSRIWTFRFIIKRFEWFQKKCAFFFLIKITAPERGIFNSWKDCNTFVQLKAEINKPSKISIAMHLWCKMLNFKVSMFLKQAVNTKTIIHVR